MVSKTLKTSDMAALFRHCPVLKEQQMPKTTANKYTGGLITNIEEAYNLANSGFLFTEQDIGYHSNEITYEEFIGFLMHPTKMSFENYMRLKMLNFNELKSLCHDLFISGLTQLAMNYEEKIFAISRCYYPNFNYSGMMKIRNYIHKNIKFTFNEIELMKKLIGLTAENSEYGVTNTEIMFMYVKFAGQEVLNDILELIEAPENISANLDIARKYEIVSSDPAKIIKAIYDYIPYIILRKTGKLNNLQSLEDYIRGYVSNIIPGQTDKQTREDVVEILYKLQHYKTNQLKLYTFLINYKRNNLIYNIAYLMQGPNFYKKHNKIHFGNVPEINPNISSVSSDSDILLEEAILVGSINYRDPISRYLKCLNLLLTVHDPEYDTIRDIIFDIN